MNTSMPTLTLTMICTLPLLCISYISFTLPPSLPNSTTIWGRLIMLPEFDMKPLIVSEGSMHCCNAFDRLRAQREQGRYCDLTLSIGGRKFQSHRCVMASVSSWFDSRLKMHKTMKEEIEIDCQNLEVFYAVLTYCYTGQITIQRSNVDEILILSDKYAISKLKAYCVDYLSRCINTELVFKVLHLAVRIGSSDLIKQCVNFIHRRFDHLCHRGEMMALNYSVFKAILNECLSSVSQNILLMFITQWVDCNIPEREGFFMDLLPMIQWSSMEPQFVTDHIERTPLYQNSQECLYGILGFMFEQQGMYLSSKLYDLYQNLQERFLQEPDLEELNDSTSFLSLALNIKDLEHPGVDTDWLLQNEPPPQDSGLASYRSVEPGPSSGGGSGLPKMERYKDSIELDIVEQLINEQRMSEERGKYRDPSSSVKRYDPKFRALNEVFRQNEMGPDPISVALPSTSGNLGSPPPTSSPSVRIDSRSNNSLNDRAFGKNLASCSESGPMTSVSSEMVHGSLDSHAMGQEQTCMTRPKYDISNKICSELEFNQNKCLEPWVSSLEHGAPQSPVPLTATRSLHEDGLGRMHVPESQCDQHPRETTLVKIPVSDSLSHPQELRTLHTTSKLIYDDDANDHGANEVDDPDHSEIIPGTPTPPPSHQNQRDCQEALNFFPGSHLRAHRRASISPDPIMTLSPVYRDDQNDENQDKDLTAASPLSKKRLVLRRRTSPTPKNEEHLAPNGPTFHHQGQKQHVKKAKLLAEHRKLGDGDAQLHQNKSSEFMLKCDHCPYKTSIRQRMKAHARQHVNGVVLDCPKCPFQSKWKKEMSSHIQELHFPGPPFHCDFEECSYSKHNLYVFLEHRKTHGTLKGYKCDVKDCSFATKTKCRLLIHKRTHERTFYCVECPKTFTSTTALVSHKQVHAKGRPFACEQCDFTTKFKSNMNFHKRIHEGKIFRCAFENCSYSTPKMSYFTNHQRIHSGEKTFKCPVCNKGFVEKSQMTRHKLIHTDEMPFACSKCDFKTKRKDKLKSHLLRIHGINGLPNEKRAKFMLKHVASKPTSE
ncbi:hypothetical protein TCAL_05574 [Tigriopus californicus]|uniref:BTB domain-containing protein n=1 Tax=Tigriopus californicus TaxID=6832 RepID=A0A553NF24_TIGCA|nr:hypothetical protein TCAL_05574 [Tigriopus californicus]|eukprot:TCALIF_05574-PA protein Name:"Similar to ZNF761 Zinc finger protein 761 (Homo sapiens)" AED:0.14 eAED:0.14 QI:0/0/0/0.5/0/0.5/2/0/1050